MRAPLLTKTFVLLMAAHFLYALSFNLYVHLPGYLVSLGADELGVGTLYAAMAATAIAARPAMGRIMDVKGRRALILLGGVIAIASSAAYLVVHRLGVPLYAVRIAQGLAEAMLFASLFAYAADIVPEARRIEGIALFGVSGMLPLAIAGVLGELLVARGGYRLLFIAATALNTAAVVLSFPLAEPPRSGEPPRGVLKAFADARLAPLWVCGLVFAFGVAAHQTFAKTFVLSRGFGSLGGFYGAYSIAAVTLRIVAGRLPERIGPKRVLYPALGSFAAGLMLLALSHSAAEIVAAGVLCGIGHGYTFPILVGLVVGRARASERGAALAIFTALFDLGTVLGGPTLGAIVKSAGYTPMFAAAAGVVLAGGGAFALMERSPSRPVMS